MENNYKKTLKEIKKINPDASILDGYNDCIIGICESLDGARLLYSEKRIINKLTRKMSIAEATQYFEENLLSGFFGTYSPVYLMDIE